MQLSFKRLDGEIRAMQQQAGGREDDAGVRLQVQRQLAQALFKLSVEFRWGLFFGGLRAGGADVVAAHG